jgi:hypothetical protein
VAAGVRRTEGRKDGRTEGRKDGKTERRKDGRDGWMDIGDLERMVLRITWGVRW